MTLIRAVARLPYFTGVPEDVATNTFHYFAVGDATPDTYDEIMQSIIDFYTVDSPTNSVDQYIAPWVSRAADACQVECYDLDQPEPRVPVASQSFTLGTVSGTGGLPAEAALCLSYRGVFESGTPNARRRGRIYIGPLSSSAIDAGSASTFPTPNTGFRTALLNAAATHLVPVTTAEVWRWVIYSPTAGTWESVIEAWVDNAIDTQRRRGNAPSSRTTIVIDQNPT